MYIDSSLFLITRRRAPRRKIVEIAELFVNNNRRSIGSFQPRRNSVLAKALPRSRKSRVSDSPSGLLEHSVDVPSEGEEGTRVHHSRAFLLGGRAHVQGRYLAIVWARRGVRDRARVLIGGGLPALEVHTWKEIWPNGETPAAINRGIRWEENACFVVILIGKGVEIWRIFRKDRDGLSG